jgi:hypothetical protein
VVSGTRGIRGEVSERQKLLDGTVHLSLEGEASGLFLAATFAWQLARAGEVELIEGDLTLEDRSVSDGTHELYALLRVGTCVIDADTGVARIEGSYLVDGLIGDWLMLGAAGREGGRLPCRFEIGATEWQGELNVPGIDLG